MKCFNERHFARSRIINKVKAMLNLAPHSSLPLLFGVYREPDPTCILITQFISLNQESATLDNLITSRLVSVKWSESCSPDHLFLLGFIHNDMKPNNVMVEKRGLHYNAVIIDFAKACPQHVKTLHMLMVPLSL